MLREEVPRVPQVVILLHGQGGTCKTEVVKLLRRVFQRFLCGGEVAMASSNSAARVIDGDTIHTAVGLGAGSSLRLDKMGRTVPARLVDKYRNVCALIFEETSMIQPQLLGAASWRICCAREKTFPVDPLLYTERGHMFGAIPIVLFFGDFYQLEPVTRYGPKLSLMRPMPLNASSEARNGQQMFLEGVTDALFFFEDAPLRGPSGESPRPVFVPPRFLAGHARGQEADARCLEKGSELGSAWSCSPSPAGAWGEGWVRDGHRMAGRRANDAVSRYAGGR